MVIVGGDPDDSTSAKVWSPKKQCCLPPLMPHTMFSPTVNSLSHRVIACGGSTCFELKKKPRAEIAKEAKAFNMARKKNAGRMKPKKVEESPRGRWQQLGEGVFHIRRKVAGSMTNSRGWQAAHGVTEIPLEAVTSMCLANDIALD